MAASVPAGPACHLRYGCWELVHPAHGTTWVIGGLSNLHPTRQTFAGAAQNGSNSRGDSRVRNSSTSRTWARPHQPRVPITHAKHSPTAIALPHGASRSLTEFQRIRAVIIVRCPTQRASAACTHAVPPPDLVQSQNQTVVQKSMRIIRGRHTALDSHEIRYQSQKVLQYLKLWLPTIPASNTPVSLSLPTELHRILTRNRLQ